MLLTIGFSTVSFAQQTKGDIEFGVNFGFNRTTAGTSKGSYPIGYGFNVGTSADYYFSDRWSIKLKAIYDQKGWNGYFSDDQSNSYEGRLNMNYITLPLMANWHFGGKRNWYLNFGSYASFLLNADEVVHNHDYKGDFNSTDFGLSYGIGVKIPLNNKLKLFLEYEEQAGLLEIFKTNDTGNKFTTSKGSFNVGLNFLLR